MLQKVGDAMTRNPVICDENTPIQKVAQKMKDADIGAVIICKKDGTVSGIVTDRDVAIRAAARGAEMMDTPVSAICSADLASLSPSDDTQNAVELMRKKSIRRIPVIDNGTPVGILSLGDLAIDRDPRSALGDISSAPPNQ